MLSIVFIFSQYVHPLFFNEKQNLIFCLFIKWRRNEKTFKIMDIIRKSCEFDLTTKHRCHLNKLPIICTACVRIGLNLFTAKVTKFI